MKYNLTQLIISKQKLYLNFIININYYNIKRINLIFFIYFVNNDFFEKYFFGYLFKYKKNKIYIYNIKDESYFSISFFCPFIYTWLTYKY
jgi:hypothetical protein